jgi:DNA-directed RNA polymerase specialized sigma24 family protein
VPEQGTQIFDLYVIEGFSKKEVAKILNISPDQVSTVAERVKAQVRKDLEGQQGERASVKRKTS